MKKKTLRLKVIGDVVGVGFRAWAKRVSGSFKITGWVKNNYNDPTVFGARGGVEMILQGQKEELLKMVDAVKLGSPASRVDRIIVEKVLGDKYFEDFKIVN